MQTAIGVFAFMLNAIGRCGANVSVHRRLNKTVLVRTPAHIARPENVCVCVSLFRTRFGARATSNEATTLSSPAGGAHIVDLHNIRVIYAGHCS